MLIQAGALRWSATNNLRSEAVTANVPWPSYPHRDRSGRDRGVPALRLPEDRIADNMRETPGDTSGRNYYDELFDRLSVRSSTSLAVELVAEAYMDGKPLVLRKRSEEHHV